MKEVALLILVCVCCCCCQENTNDADFVLSDAHLLLAQNSSLPPTFLRQDPDDQGGAFGCGCGQFSCGLPNREDRVLGGAITRKVEYPWLAFLTYRGKLYCGGSLINDRFLVTAGHCIHRVTKEKVIVHLGKHLRLSRESSTEYKIKNWHIHPKFNRRTFQNDIGVIELDKPVTLSKYLRPICLPTQDGDYAGEFGTVVGWGRTTEKGTSSDYPREIKVPIMTNSECQTKKYQPNEITNNMFCAGYDQGKIDACQGDSGGPLMLEIRGARGQSHYELTGVVSWGQGCGRSGYPGVYTRTAKYLSFVKDHVALDCYC